MHDGQNQSVGKGHTEWLGGPGCGPPVAHPFPMHNYLTIKTVSEMHNYLTIKTVSEKMFSLIEIETSFLPSRYNISSLEIISSLLISFLDTWWQMLRNNMSSKENSISRLLRLILIFLLAGFYRNTSKS